MVAARRCACASGRAMGMEGELRRQRQQQRRGPPPPACFASPCLCPVEAEREACGSVAGEGGVWSWWRRDLAGFFHGGV